MLRAFLASVALVIVSGCAPASVPTHAPDTLVALARADGNTMNPLYAQGQQDGVIYQSLLFDSLTVVGPGLAMVPDLATRWQASPDGLHWNVTLRRGVRWSDGAPFTVRDVLFTYRLMQNPKTAYVGVGSLEALHDVVATGPNSVRFNLTHVTAKFDSDILGQPMLPEHVLGAIPPAQQITSDFGERPIGTGPYVLQRWQHDTEAMFARNSFYWRGRPNIARIDFRIIFNDQAEVDALESGAADLIDFLGYSQSKRLAKEAPSIKQILVSPLEVGVFEPNLRRPGLRDVVVRRAMMYAFDRQAMIDGFLEGHATLARSIVPPALTRWYDPHTLVYRYEPARARALLDAAGWKLGSDGVRRKGAVRLDFEALVNQGSTIVLDELLAFAADEAQVGIRIRPRLLDFPSVIERGYRGDYDLIFDDRGGSIDPDPSYLFLSTQRPPNGGNTVGYDDPTADRLIDAGIRALSYPKRRAIYNQLQEYLAETLPMLWELCQPTAIGHDARLHLSEPVLPFPLLWTDAAKWTLTP